MVHLGSMYLDKQEDRDIAEMELLLCFECSSVSFIARNVGSVKAFERSWFDFQFSSVNAIPHLFNESNSDRKKQDATCGGVPW